MAGCGHLKKRRGWRGCVRAGRRKSRARSDGDEGGKTRDRVGAADRSVFLPEALAEPPAETGRDRARPSRSVETAGYQGWRDDLRVVRLGSARASTTMARLGRQAAIRTRLGRRSRLWRAAICCRLRATRRSRVGTRRRQYRRGPSTGSGTRRPLGRAVRGRLSRAFRWARGRSGLRALHELLRSGHQGGAQPSRQAASHE